MKPSQPIILFSAVLITTLLLITSCGEESASVPATAEKTDTDINPNGSSELALLMRDMHDAAVAAKAEIEKGQTPDIQIDFSSLTTAEPTQPQMIAYTEFEPLAASYIASMQALAHAEDSTQAAQAYTTVVNTCMSCHEVSCKGPIPRIRKLYLQP